MIANSLAKDKGFESLGTEKKSIIFHEMTKIVRFYKGLKGFVFSVVIMYISIDSPVLCGEVIHLYLAKGSR